MAQTRKNTKKTTARTGAKKTAKPAQKSAHSKAGKQARSGAGKKAGTTAGKKAGTTAAGEHPAVALVRGLAEVVDAHSLSELVYDTPELTLTMRRGAQDMPATVVQHAVPAIAAPTPVMAAAAAPVAVPPEAAPERPAPEEESHVVTSPFVGTFYRRPNPDSDPYVKVGDQVEKGQALCIVEAMKLMNEIEADVSGIIVEILVQDSNPVEYGQSLFKIASE